MPIEFAALNLPLDFRFTPDAMQELAPLIDIIVSPSRGRDLVAQVTAGTMDELVEVLAAFARQKDDPDRIAAIRIDEEACRAELDVATRPVDPRRLN